MAPQLKLHTDLSMLRIHVSESFYAELKQMLYFSFHAVNGRTCLRNTPTFVILYVEISSNIYHR